MKNLFGVDEICLSCRYFQLRDPYSGVCRVDKSVEPSRYPMKKNEETCEKWTDSAQQYYIRQGWIKRQLADHEKKTDG